MYKKDLIQSIKKFFTLFIGALVWFSIFTSILLISEKLGNFLTVFFIVIFLILTILLYIYFSKRNTLIEDKSFKAVIFSIKMDIKNFLKQLKDLFFALLKIGKIVLIVAIVLWVFSGIFSGDKDSKIESDSYQKGNMINSGGSPTYRQSYTPSYDDDYSTTNDESNDQPVGFYGTDTMNVCSGSSGNCYDLDVDSDGENIERIYFPKGGWVDIDSSDCDDGYCTAEDEDGNEWELEY